MNDDLECLEALLLHDKIVVKVGDARLCDWAQTATRVIQVIPNSTSNYPIRKILQFVSQILSLRQ